MWIAGGIMPLEYATLTELKTNLVFPWSKTERFHSEIPLPYSHIKKWSNMTGEAIATTRSARRSHTSL